MKRNSNFKPVLNLKNLIVIFMLLNLMACQVPYMMESAWTHLKIMSSKESIEHALKNKNLSEDWKNKLQLSLDIRPYIQSLGLKITKNYQTFVDVKKPYISHLLIVTPAYSLNPKKWWFPIVGSFPYKGFHSPEKALKAQKYYIKKGKDTYVRGVSAYSTLGWFNDPLLSTMMMYTEPDLVETIIHESVHTTIFIKNDVDFNENLAVFIAKKATLNYYKEHSEEQYLKLLSDYKNDNIFAKFLSESYKKLDAFYKDSSLHSTDQKIKMFDSLREDYQVNYLPKITDAKYDYVLRADLNNAFFAAQKTYYMDQEQFESVYKQIANEDLKVFIEKLKNMKGPEIKKLFLKN